MAKIKFGARFTPERLALYVAVGIAFTSISISLGTTSWLLKDWKKIMVAYHGICDHDFRYVVIPSKHQDVDCALKSLQYYHLTGLEITVGHRTLIDGDAILSDGTLLPSDTMTDGWKPEDAMKKQEDIKNVDHMMVNHDIATDDVFGDEYKGLWKICYDRPNRGLESSCFERVGDAFMNNVRSSMCLAFLSYAVVLGYIIAMQFRADLRLTPLGLALIVSAMSALFGLTLFIATQEIPREHWLFEIKYGYSFGFGWFGMCVSMITGVACISLPKIE